MATNHRVTGGDDLTSEDRVTGGDDVAGEGRVTGGADHLGVPGSWRLAGIPGPRLAERFGRAVGAHVWRLPGTRRVLVLVGSIDRLRELTARPVSLTPIRRARVVVAYWRAPRRGWSGGIGALDHLVRHRVALPVLGRGAATVTVRLSRPAVLRDVLDSALHALGPARPMPAPASADVTALDLLPAYLPAQRPAGAVLGELPRSEQIRAHDIVLRPLGSATVLAEPPPYAVAYDATRHAVHGPDGPLVLVDARRINPRGRRASAYQPDAPRARLEFGTPPDRRLGATADRQGGTADGWRVGRGRPLDGPGLDASTLAVLRHTGVVECPPVADADPVEVAALLVQLAMTGVVVHAPELPPRVADLIVPELRALLTASPDADRPLEREARSVRQRRAALRGHATAFALPRLAAPVFADLARPPAVSAILVTRRPEMLTAALGALVGQTYPELEIVLCLHGVALPAEHRALLTDAGRPYEVVRVPETASFGAALGAATRRARGSLVAKFDDDDSYSTEHVWDLVLARHYSGATLVGKGIEFVYLETLGVTVRRSSGVPEADGELVAGGTMLIGKGDLEAVGGWRPVPRSVDHGLIERLRRDGATIYRTHPFGYVYHRRASGHTWDPGQQYFLDNAFARWEGMPPDVVLDLAAPAADPESA